MRRSRANAPKVVHLVTACLLAALLLPFQASACQRIGGLFPVGDDCGSGKQPPSREEIAREAERSLLSLVNRSRAGRDLRTLSLDGRAIEMARDHAWEMARHGKVYHNPALRTRAGMRALGRPSVVGENVGNGPNAGSIHEAFMKSTPHRKVILKSKFRLAGIGVYNDGRQLWVVELLLSRARAAERSPAYAAAGRSPSGGHPGATAISTPHPIRRPGTEKPVVAARRNVSSAPNASRRALAIPESHTNWVWVVLILALVTFASRRAWRPKSRLVRA